MNPASKRPHVIVLGSNFAGLASAQHVRDYCGDKVVLSIIEQAVDVIGAGGNLFFTLSSLSGRR